MLWNFLINSIFISIFVPSIVTKRCIENMDKANPTIFPRERI